MKRGGINKRIKLSFKTGSTEKKSINVRIDFVMVWSYYVGVFDHTKEQLLEIIHHDKHVHNKNAINNLVTIFSLEERQEA
jgi:hypothetical protein